MHRHPHRYIQAFTKHTDILIPYQTHTYHRHAQTTYTHSPHWHIHTPTHIFIFTHSNLKELALNSKTEKQHQVNSVGFFKKRTHEKGRKKWWWVDKGAMREGMVVSLKTHYMHV